MWPCYDLTYIHLEHTLTSIFTDCITFLDGRNKNETETDGIYEKVILASFK